MAYPVRPCEQVKLRCFKTTIENLVKKFVTRSQQRS